MDAATLQNRSQAGELANTSLDVPNELAAVVALDSSRSKVMNAATQWNCTWLIVIDNERLLKGLQRGLGCPRVIVGISGSDMAWREQYCTGKQRQTLTFRARHHTIQL